jgi:hypothetical protein
MKKLTFIILIIAFAYSDSLAQVFRERNRTSYIGLRGGYSIAGWSGLVYNIPEINYKNISGFHGGLFVSVKIADNFTVEPAVYYSQRGWSIDGKIDDGTNLLEGSMVNKISYIDAPIMFRIYLKGLNFGIGPQVALPIKSELDFTGKINGKAGTSHYENTVDLQDFEVALALAIGYEFNFGLSFHATYDLGLTDTAKLYPYPIEFPYWTESKSRTIKFSVGFMIY